MPGEFLNSSTKQVIIYHHLGLGDHFICNGIVNFLSEKLSVILPCKKHNESTVSSLYKNNPQVTVVAISDENHDITKLSLARHAPILKIGFEYLNITKTIWYKAFYNQLDIDYKTRYTKFLLPDNIAEQTDLYNRLLRESKPYIVVHKASSVNSSYNIDYMQGRDESLLPTIVEVTPNESNNLLAWTKVFQNAEEIHVVESSVFCLIDSIADTCQGRLYFHKIRKPSMIDDQDLQENGWNIIYYD